MHNPHHDLVELCVAHFPLSICQALLLDEITPVWSWDAWVP